MMAQANAVRSVQNWHWKPWNGWAVDPAGTTLIRVAMIHVYEGDISGEGTIQYLVANNGDGRGSFVALEKVVGTLAAKQGSFVFQHSGTFDKGWIKQTSIVVPGTGTRSLSGLHGQAAYEGEHRRERHPVLLDYQLEETA